MGGLLVTVKVLLMGELRQWAGTRELEIELPQESTVQTLTEKLLSLCGESFAKRATTGDGRLIPHIAVFINGEDIRQHADLQTTLSGGVVELMLLPMYEGGSEKKSGV